MRGVWLFISSLYLIRRIFAETTEGPFSECNNSNDSCKLSSAEYNCNSSILFEIPKQASNKYTLELTNFTISCLEFTVAIISKFNTEVAITFTDSWIEAKEVIIDTGKLSMAEQTSVTLINSTIYTDMTVNRTYFETGQSSYQFISKAGYYTGACLPLDDDEQYFSQNFNIASQLYAIWSNTSYGSEVLPTQVDLPTTEDLVKLFDKDEYLGTASRDGSDEDYSFGGGKVLIRTKKLFLSKRSNISSSAFEDTYYDNKFLYFTGSGGSIIVVAGSITVDNPKAVYFKAKGGIVYHPSAFAGSGGRIYFHIENEDDFESIARLANTSSYHPRKTAPYVNSIPGTIYVQNGAKKLLFVDGGFEYEKDKIIKTGFSNCYTVINSLNLPGATEEPNFTVLIQNSAKVIFGRINYNTSRERFWDMQTITVRQSSSLYLLPAYNSTTHFNIETDFLRIQSNSRLVPLSNISFSIDGDLTISGKSDIVFPWSTPSTVHALYSPQVQTNVTHFPYLLLSIKAKDINIERNCSIRVPLWNEKLSGGLLRGASASAQSTTDSPMPDQFINTYQFTKNRRVFPLNSGGSAYTAQGILAVLILSPIQSLSLSNAKLSADHILIDLTSLPIPTLSNVFIYGNGNYCPGGVHGYSAGLVLDRLDKLVESIKDPVWIGGTQRLLEKYWMSSIANVSALSGSYSVQSPHVLLLGFKDIQMDGVKIRGSGNTVIYSGEGVYVNKGSVISGDVAGCPPTMPDLQAVASKYMKICKVVGGSNGGRGNLGSQINFENCKYVLSRYNEAKYPNTDDTGFTVGIGGQKSSQIETDGYGFGGGVVYIRGRTVALEGQIFANGGNSSEKDYSMVAGGSGGTIRIEANDSIILGGLLSVRGGSSDAELGGGGGGKLQFDCKSWASKPNCIALQRGYNPELSSGDTDSNIIGPKYFVTMRMTQRERPNLFLGTIKNINSCRPGYGGELCQRCPFGTYSFGYTTEPCTACPCELIADKECQGLTQAGDCPCVANDPTFVSLYEVVLVLVFINVMIWISYRINLRHSTVREENPDDDGDSLAPSTSNIPKTFVLTKNNTRFKIKDIRYSFGRIILCGSNDYDDPWFVGELNHHVMQHFNKEAFKTFCDDIKTETSWSTGVRYLCMFLHLVNLSPSFLLVQRVFRVQRVNNFISLVKQQQSYGLFPDDKPYVLKYTVTSDKAKAFLDICLSDEEQLNILIQQNQQLDRARHSHGEATLESQEYNQSQQDQRNWELPFPQKFIIFGTGSYNQPFKMEIRDPLMIKTIDHLKDVIDNLQRYYEIFKFPDYLIKTSKSTAQSGHFIEYYFCWLNVNLKTLSRREPLGKFMAKWEHICVDIIQTANIEVFRPNGYQLKLRFELTTKGRSNRYPYLLVPLDKEHKEDLKSLGTYFYYLRRSSRLDHDYELFLYVEKLKIGGNKYENRGQDQLDSPEDEPRERKSELIQLENIKNNMKQGIIQKQAKLESQHINFDQLNLYSGLKSRENPIVTEAINYLFWLTYRHHAPRKAYNFLLVAVMILMAIEAIYYGAIVMLSNNDIFSIMDSIDMKTYLLFDFFFPLPLVHGFALIMGMLCYFTNWTVKVGKMFVSCKMMEVVSTLISLSLWVIYATFFNSQQSGSNNNNFPFPYKVVGFMLPKIILNILISYMSCVLVSRVQSSKTMHKILVSCNIKLN